MYNKIKHNNIGIRILYVNKKTNCWRNSSWKTKKSNMFLEIPSRTYSVIQHANGDVQKSIKKLNKGAICNP